MDADRAGAARKTGEHDLKICRSGIFTFPRLEFEWQTDIRHPFAKP